MAEPYNVLYTGQLKQEVDLEQAVAAFAARFRVHPQKVRDLIGTGGEVVLRAGLDRAGALEYREALDRMGLLVRVDPPIDPPGDEDGPADAAPAGGPDAKDTESAPAVGGPPGNDDSGGGDRDPFEPPRAELEDAQGGDFHEPRSVPFSRGWGWLREGFSMVFASPLGWIGAIVVWTLLGLVLNLVPVINFLAAMLTSVFMGGLMLGAHEQRGGKAFTIGHLFAGFSRRLGPLFLVGVLYMVGFLAIALGVGAGVGGLMFAAAGGSEVGGTPPEALFFEPMVWLFMLLALALMIPLIMAYWFAPALVIIDDVSALSAMGMSFRACLKNILPFLLYGLIGMVLFILGAVPLFLGLLLVVPAIAASVYTSYSDIFRR